MSVRKKAPPKSSPTRSKAKKAATPAKRKPRSKASTALSKRVPGEGSSPVHDVRLALPDGSAIEWAPGPAEPRIGIREFQRVAVQWTYIVRNRRRWAERAETIQDQAKRARGLLKELGLSEPDRKRLAQAGHVEVVIPWSKEATGWELRIFPWEYLLTAGTRDLRRGCKLSVVRRLAVGKAGPKIPPAPRVLYVQSAFGALVERYDFDAERTVVEASLSPGAFEALINPTLQQLQEAVSKASPHIVHLTGFDTHQGLALLEENADNEVHDGYLLSTAAGAPHPVRAAELASAVARGRTKPALVTLNLHNSSGRLAPALLASGVGAALGFQDVFDDGLAELFLGSFYHALTLTTGDLVLAFDRAWEEMRAQPRSVQGSGLVLWSATPLLAPDVTAPTSARSNLTKQIDREREQVLLPDDESDLSKIVQVTVDPLQEANYSLLHNNRGLFKQFAIRKLKPGRLEHLVVNVELHVGSDTYPYRRSFTLTEPLVDLNALVRVPLTSALARSRNEAVHTSLFVEVLWGRPGEARELYRDTHRIALLPADQWRDDDVDRIWLPSFVLPRDPAVARVIDRAQRYLMTLRDDPTAGFDGYQSYDEEGDDPAACIDQQVQAIWSAIVHDFRLSYINPPPAYSVASQRIRTPTEILASARGTCLDLTLLLAACLEFVEIYPVIFLLSGHAFPGYWRSDGAHAAFVEVASCAIDAADAADAQQTTHSAGQRDAWYLPKQSWPEMIQQVRAGDLVPLESVWLTTNSGFWDAVDAGHDNLAPKREFDSLLDVLLARVSGVTPLPIREETT